MQPILSRTRSTGRRGTSPVASTSKSSSRSGASRRVTRVGAMNLEGKVAVVTGSGRGIGRAYALALAQSGCAVVVNDVDADVAEATADEIAAGGGRVVAEVCAVGSAEAADQLVSGAVKAFGHLDIMCTNAGILRDRVLWNMSDDDFDVVIETHLRGTFTCARAAVRRMWGQGTGGRIVVGSSLGGQA